MIMSPLRLALLFTALAVTLTACTSQRLDYDPKRDRGYTGGGVFTGSKGKWEINR